jgi:hypothetical protein
MSLFESGHSSGAVSVSALFDGAFVPVAATAMTVPDIIDRIVGGGWPGLIGQDPRTAQRSIRSYLGLLVEEDAEQLFAHRSPERLARLVSSLARNTGTSVSQNVLARDVGGEHPVHHETITNYLDVLKRLMVTEDVPAWTPHMRSKTGLQQQPTRFMMDPSLAAAALKRGPAVLLKDLKATGFLFENLVARDLRVYTSTLGGSLSHWRDRNGNEVDFIVTLDDDRWAAVEVKLGLTDVEDAVKSLLRLNSKVDTSVIGEPEFLAVITATGPAFRRTDGVFVLPIGALGP